MVVSHLGISEIQGVYLQGNVSFREGIHIFPYTFFQLRYFRANIFYHHTTWRIIPGLVSG